MGSKCSSIYVETDDVRILVDPGLSGLQPGFPIPPSWKAGYNTLGYAMIEKFASQADVVIITHYHYDHLEIPGSSLLDTGKVYPNKLILIKDPNQYINISQFERARIFFASLVKYFLNKDLEEFLIEPRKSSFQDPLDWIPLAIKKDYGDYNKRRREILENGRKRFRNLCQVWVSNQWIKEPKEGPINVEFADGREFSFGATRIRFTKPLFHGIEYDRLGWVIGFVIERKGEKLLYTSDVQGPFIEDYAEWIISENPNIAIIDGPPTYQYGYMMTRTNFRRTLDNMIRIINETDTDIIIWDHHLLRDIRWRERVSDVYKVARRKRRKLMVASEYFGKRPVADLAKRLVEKKRIVKKHYIIPPITDTRT